ncbi:putative ATP-dependent RNA helicase TDRD12 isoform X2 [Brienomyrus brachyistius]|nr:putative ATP-dependent RNA helicase TDRD12 isoform X2 [Brienomyrus brachyistius]XP_048829649.1 putative ATP-dependent RNA helicase TDRD12 isoform X2 [Brienomyrus brachyistius]
MEAGGPLLEIDILKIEDPSCFWGRIVKGAGVCVEDQEYEKLKVKMNLFYHDVNLDVQKLKPPLLEEGQVCVVYSPAMRSWCRAVMESLFLSTAGSQVLCFLLDHAEHVIVDSDSIRAPLEKFLQLPFWVRRFQLAGIYPLTLEVSACLQKATLKRASCWDSSATRYLHELIQASTLKEAVVCGQNAESTAVQLYLTIRDIKICVNDEFVTKRFACFSSAKPEQSLQDYGANALLIASNTLASGKSPLRVQNHDMGVQSGTRQNAEITCEEKDGVDFWSGSNGQKVPENHVPHPSPEGAQVTAERVRHEEETGAGAESSSNGKQEKQPSSSHLELAPEPGTSPAEDLSQKLNLLRFLWFLNPISKTGFIPKDDPEEVVSMEGAGSAVLPDGLSSTVAACVGADSHLAGDQAQEVTDHGRIGDQLTCARLLQFLNPDPLNPDRDSSEMPFWQDPYRSRILLHSPMTFEPCGSLAAAPISDGVRKALLQTGYGGPTLADCQCWPPVSRGCDTLLIAQTGSDPMCYIPPFLTHLQLCAVRSALTSCSGPIAAVLCPGWQKAQRVSGLLEELPAGASLHPTLVLLGRGKAEAEAAHIPSNCQLLVTTPSSLLQLLQSCCFLFLRLCHLVLDDVDLLYTRVPQETCAVLQHFRKEERSLSLRQLVAVGTRWNHHMEALVKESMRDPCVVITVPEEAALYGSVRQMVLLCLETTKMSVLLNALDFVPDVAQKTLIFTSTAEETEEVFKAVRTTAFFCLKVHEKLTHQFSFVAEQWRSDIGPGTQVVLVTTDDCVRALHIDDATCVVHYGFPRSPKLFGSRLYCMSRHFRNLSDKVCSSLPSREARSVLLLSEGHARHVVGLWRYLERTGTELPNELLRFTHGLLQAKELQKSARPLCSYLKNFGFCRDDRVCPNRHQIDPQQDAPRQPDSHNILFVPLHIKNASCYYGRIVSGEGSGYECLARDMAAHYSREKIHAVELVQGGLYTVQEDDVYHRVRLLATPDTEKRLFYSVNVCFLDEGREQEVKAHQLLELPGRFQALPPQAVEVVVCRVQPIDGEMDWNPKVARYISQKIKGLQHHAKVVLSLGNTIWVDPMVRLTRPPGLKTFISEYNVLSEILATGMAVLNPQHVDLLKALSQEAFVGVPPCEICPTAIEEPGTRLTLPASATGCTTNPAGEGPPAWEKVPAAAVKEAMALEPVAARLSCPALLEEPQSPSSAPTLEHSLLSRETQAGTHKTMEAVPTGSPMNEVQFPVRPVENGLSCDLKVPVAEKTDAGQKGTASADAPQWFHPQIQWFQRMKSIVINIKLPNPTGQTCEFFSDRVMYSATVNGQQYRADLVLQGAIDPDECTCVVKSGGPVLQLVKARSGLWDRLLREKNMFVSLDFEHLEDEAEKPENARWVVEHVEDVGCYWSPQVNDDSSSSSDFD